MAFAVIGLTLIRPLKNWNYLTTPRNSSTFACTGGDGVHYGLLHRNGEVSDHSPVVMSVPAHPDIPNLIVGETLEEFLRLGCQIGYGELEELVYGKDQAIYWINHPRAYVEYWLAGGSDRRVAEDFRREAEHLLEILTREFSLRPWNNVEQRLDELQEKYWPLVELSSECGWHLRLPFR